MSQSHLIVKSFKDLVASTSGLNAALPGDLHHGVRVDTSIVRPFALIVVTEKDRETFSGATLVTYEAALTIYGGQQVGVVGAAQQAFADVFNLSQSLPSVVGQVVLIQPTQCEIEEDKDSEFGKDILIGKQKWDILIQENI